MKAFVIRIATGIHMQASPQQARNGNAFEMTAILIKMFIGIHMQGSHQQARKGNALK